MMSTRLKHLAALWALAVSATCHAAGPCVPSGQGQDYLVGPGQIAALEQVPWENLQPGDTVRILWRSEPYRGKFLLMAQGTAAAPVRVCGVPGPAGEKPVVEGTDAVSRAALAPHYGGSDYDRRIHEARSVIVIKRSALQAWEAYPRFVQIDGLAVRGAHPSHQFTDTGGVRRTFEDFGACIWVDRGQDIRIEDNDVSDCTHAVFSKSSDDGDFAVTRRLLLRGNHFFGNGLAGSELVHTTYLQSIGLTLEFNHYGPLRAGALGNAVKDRSAGAVIRYNRIEQGSHALDLVEAEDYPLTALAEPRYRQTFVYGNQIIKDGATGSAIHYGGDHYGAQPGDLWGEPIYRKGTLFFFHNTVRLTGRDAVLFQISTTEEQVQAWNNVLAFDDGITWKRLRASSEVGPFWTPGGIVHLGRNWVSSGWVDSDVWHPVPGQLLGTEALIAEAGRPFNARSWAPLAGSSLLDAALDGPVDAQGHPVRWQLDRDARPQRRRVQGPAADLGAVER